MYYLWCDIEESRHSVMHNNVKTTTETHSRILIRWFSFVLLVNDFRH